MPKLKELLPLIGEKPEFKENPKKDFSTINNKSFINKHDRLKVAQQFKPVWEKSKDFLEIIAASHSKNKINQAKQFASAILFGPEKSLKNDLSLSNKGPKTPKPKMG